MSDALRAALPAAARIVSAQPGPQERFLRCSADVAFYGGAAGGGKTYALLLNPLRHQSNPRFGCVTFRRTTKQIKSEGGLWDTAHELYMGLRGCVPNNSDLFFRLASGAKLSFAHMEHESNRYDWQGSQIPLIQFDELTHFSWKQFNYMLSRNRSMSGIPGRVRGTLNPNPDHWTRQFIDWWIGEDGFAIDERSGVVRWFLTLNDETHWASTREKLFNRFKNKTLSNDHPDQPIPKSFTFIKSSLKDNQLLMQSDPGYMANLQAMTRVERARLLDGNWNVRETAGTFFQRSDFEIVDALPRVVKWVRAWDQAGTKADEKKKEDDGGPAWTAGVLMGRTDDGRYVIKHVERFRSDPRDVDKRLKNVTIQDGKHVVVRLAQDPGQAGKSQVHAQKTMLAGYTVRSKTVTGDKATRARPLATQVEAGNVLLLRGEWNDAFLTECENFPEGLFKDQVDAAADAFDELSSSSYTLEGV